jgi:hypothetical protein
LPHHAATDWKLELELIGLHVPGTFTIAHHDVFATRFDLESAEWSFRRQLPFQTIKGLLHADFGHVGAPQRAGGAQQDNVLETELVVTAGAA